MRRPWGRTWPKKWGWKAGAGSLDRLHCEVTFEVRRIVAFILNYDNHNICSSVAAVSVAK